jgi:hypothetical protein
VTRAVPCLLVVALAASCAQPEPATPTVDQPPVALLELPATAAVDESVDIDGTGSFDVDGELEEAVLVFGDGSEPAFNLQAAHAWRAPGSYVVELFVKDEAGSRGRARARIVVE